MGEILLFLVQGRVGSGPHSCDMWECSTGPRAPPLCSLVEQLAQARRPCKPGIAPGMGSLDLPISCLLQRDSVGNFTDRETEAQGTLTCSTSHGQSGGAWLSRQQGGVSGFPGL